MENETLNFLIFNNFNSFIFYLSSDYHGSGHTLIGYQHDPDHRHLESFGVMGENTVSMRDPAFYRWHSHIDDIFDTHKRKLNPYTTQQLTYPGIQVRAIQSTLR